MKGIRLLLIAITMQIFFVLEAKINIGIEVVPQLTSRLSWNAGVNIEIPVTDKLYLSSGAFYSLRHRYDESLWETYEYISDGKVPISYEKVSIDVHGDYIHIPFLIGYKCYARPNYTIKGAGGFYYACLLGGKSKIKMDDDGSISELSMPSFITAIDHRSDFGLCVEAECLLFRHYQIGINVQHGLRRIYQGFDIPGLREPYLNHRLVPGVQFHQSVGLSFGYLF